MKNLKAASTLLLIFVWTLAAADSPGSACAVNPPTPGLFAKISEFASDIKSLVTRTPRSVPTRPIDPVRAQRGAVDPKLTTGLHPLLPRGSALITSAGALTATGISAIIHAAPGSMTRDEIMPSADGVRSSIRNSLDLARAHGHTRVAMPLIGGGIFSSPLGLSKAQLAELVVSEALKHRGELELRFVGYSSEEFEILKRAYLRFSAQGSQSLVSHGDLTKPRSPNAILGAAYVVQGDITQFATHGASAIVNAANMEVQFGGGLSGAIGDATRSADEIDQEAEMKIRAFYASCPSPAPVQAPRR